MDVENPLLDCLASQAGIPDGVPEAHWHKINKTIIRRHRTDRLIKGVTIAGVAVGGALIWSGQKILMDPWSKDTFPLGFDFRPIDQMVYSYACVSLGIMLLLASLVLLSLRVTRFLVRKRNLKRLKMSFGD